MAEFDAYETFDIEVDSGLATVKFNRPERLNAWNRKMADELESLWLDLESEPAIRAVVLTGNGRAFSSGGDLEGFMEGSFDPLQFDVFGGILKMARSQLDLSVPLVAAVNGDAIGGAATVALLCDVVIIGKSARIGDPHVRVGVVAGDGAAAIWPLLVGPLRAKEYLMLGDLLSADEAERIGLVNRVVADEDVLPTAKALARRFVTELPPLAVKWTKYAINKGIRDALASVMEPSLALECVTLLSSDRREAVRAILERRPGEFQGR